MAAILVCLMFCLVPQFTHLTARSVDERVAGEKVLILNYHKVDEAHISLSVHPADFAAQMAYLERHGYNTISPDELYDSLAGSKRLPTNPVLITFDDGYADNYANAYPILKEHGFKATIFVVSSFVGKYRHYLTWEQAREMEQNGISIQSHTATHRSMTDLSDDQLRAELTESKQKIEAELGHPVDYIAYPTGTYNLHIAQMVKEAGYKAAFTIKYGNVDQASNIYALERVPVFHTEDTNKSFKERLHYVPLFESQGWVKN
ncbi:MAG: polysaccharide deacetylase family protein [Selenomonadaceae bacterium]|nr:polysaccharide deacetylase family protein [Selenomonadaceae bacterium]